MKHFLNFTITSVRMQANLPILQPGFDFFVRVRRILFASVNTIIVEVLRLLTTFLRSVILYTVMVITMRALGKRQLGQFQPYEFAMTIIIADLIATPIGDVSTPLLQGLLPIAALFIMHALISCITFRSDKLRSVISGKPTVIITDGVIDRREMQRLCLTLSDLMEGLRQQGILDPAAVSTAVFEANGVITAFADGRERPPTAQEMHIATRADHLPVVLIMDGRVQKVNLSEHSLTPQWLDAQLRRAALAAPAVYLATLDDDGMLRIQTMDGMQIQFPAGKEC